MRLVETKVATQALQRDAEALKTRCEAMRGEREKNLREMAAEARQTQEEIVSLLDAVSRYKETIDVGEEGGLKRRTKRRDSTRSRRNAHVNSCALFVASTIS